MSILEATIVQIFSKKTDQKCRNKKVIDKTVEGLVHALADIRNQKEISNTLLNCKSNKIISVIIVTKNISNL